MTVSCRLDPLLAMICFVDNTGANFFFSSPKAATLCFLSQKLRARKFSFILSFPHCFNLFTSSFFFSLQWKQDNLLLDQEFDVQFFGKKKLLLCCWKEQIQKKKSTSKDEPLLDDYGHVYLLLKWAHHPGMVHRTAHSQFDFTWALLASLWTIWQVSREKLAYICKCQLADLGGLELSRTRDACCNCRNWWGVFVVGDTEALSQHQKVLAH